MDKNTVGNSESIRKKEVSSPEKLDKTDLSQLESTDNQVTSNVKIDKLTDNPEIDKSIRNSPSDKSEFTPLNEVKKPDAAKDISDIGPEEPASKKGALETGSPESIYFHQYDHSSNNGKFPPSLLIVQDKDDVTMAMVATTDGKGKKKLEFKELTEALHKDSGHSIELFTNKDLLSAAIDNFRAGYNQTNLVFDKVYVALKRPQEKVRQWVDAIRDGENSKIIYKDVEIPFSALEKVGIDRKHLDKAQVAKLLRGDQTELIRTDLKSGDIELKDIPPFTIKLERKGSGIEARLTFKKDALDINKDKIGKDLSRPDQLELLKEGKVSQVSINNENGKPERQEIVWNKATNALERIDSSKEPINIKALELTYGIKLSQAQAGNLQAGKKILVDNILDPGTNKTEKAYMSLDSDKKIVRENVNDREKDRSKDLIER